MTETPSQRKVEVEIDHLIDNAPISHFQKRILALCALASFLDGYDIQALGLAIPRMAEDFHLPPTAFAGALSGSLIGVAVGAMTLAPLADRHGRRPLMITMMIVIGLSTFGAMLAPTPFVLMLWRFITGLGLGAAVPVAVAMAAEYAPARSRVALVTMVIACVALGSFGSGMIAPVLDSLWGWRGIFAAGALLPLLMAAVLWAAFPESLRFLISRKADPKQVANQIARIAPAFAGAVPVVAARARVEKASVRALFGPIYRHRTILLWVIFWFNLFAAYSLISWLPTLLHSAGWTQGEAQRATGLLALGGIAGGVLISLLVRRENIVKAVTCAYILTALLLCLFVVGPASRSVWMVMVPLVGAGLYGGLMALSSISAAFYYPPELCSTGVGWYNGIGRIGAIAGPLALAGLMRAGWAPASILAVLMVPMLICVGGVLLLPRSLSNPP